MFVRHNSKMGGATIKKLSKNVVVIGLILVLICPVGVHAAQSILISKITNFIIVVDQSGSMFKNFGQTKKNKATLAKEVLLKVNERIPELGYTGAIQVFAPDRTLIGPEVYNRINFKNVISKLPEEGEILGNFTPMGAAIRFTKNNIPLFEGKIAIILVSDGIADITDDPLKASNEIYNKYSNICFHAISVADRDNGKRTLKEICEVNNCAYTEGVDLLSDAEALDRFLAEVFYLEVPEEKLEQLFTPPELMPEASLDELLQEDILFDFDKYDLKPEWLAFLDGIADALLKLPNVQIVIEGHTDWNGPEAYNQKLSERRARAVYDYLLGKDIENARMDIIGYGETMPAVSNLTREGRMLNRRAVIIVTQ